MVLCWAMAMLAAETHLWAKMREASWAEERLPMVGPAGNQRMAA